MRKPKHTIEYDDADVMEMLKRLDCGGVRATARVFDVSPTFMGKILSGEEKPTPKIAEAFGLVRHICWIKEEES